MDTTPKLSTELWIQAEQWETSWQFLLLDKNTSLTSDLKDGEMKINLLSIHQLNLIILWIEVLWYLVWVWIMQDKSHATDGLVKWIIMPLNKWSLKINKREKNLSLSTLCQDQQLWVHMIIIIMLPIFVKNMVSGITSTLVGVESFLGLINPNIFLMVQKDLILHASTLTKDKVYQTKLLWFL